MVDPQASTNPDGGKSIMRPMKMIWICLTLLLLLPGSLATGSALIRVPLGESQTLVRHPGHLLLQREEEGLHFPGHLRPLVDLQQDPQVSQQTFSLCFIQYYRSAEQYPCQNLFRIACTGFSSASARVNGSFAADS